jgi:hypothetical protein
MKEAKKAVEIFKKEFLEELHKLPEGRLSWESIKPLADVAAILSAAYHLDMDADHPETGSWTDDITEELQSAEMKYNDYLKSNDTTMLEMARQELGHANYYINKAKMSPDMELRRKIPQYEKKYQEIAAKLNSPHGNEKLGRL